MSDAAPIRTVTAPLSRTVVPAEPPGADAIHAAMGHAMSSCASVAEAMDEDRRSKVRKLAAELERELGRRFHCQPRCVGYARDASTDIGMTIIHDGELVFLTVRAPTPYPSEGVRSYLLTHAIHAIAKRTGVEPQEV